MPLGLNTQGAHQVSGVRVPPASGSGDHGDGEKGEGHAGAGH